MSHSNEIAPIHYYGLRGLSKVTLGTIARSEGIQLSKDAQRGLNIAGLRDLIARNRKDAALAVTTVVHSHGSRFIIHVYENGKHTGNTYAAADEAHRDELLAIIAAA